MRHVIGAALVLAGIGGTLAPLSGQPAVPPRQMYERLMVVVPLIGKGTIDDPVRPMYAPVPALGSLSKTLAGAAGAAPIVAARTGIIGYSHVVSDDGKFALVEFVGRDRSAFQTILADQTLKPFIKGVHAQADVETEFKKYKKDFDINKFGAYVQ
jgi:hypothetical protein